MNFDAVLRDDSAIIQYKQFLSFTDDAFNGTVRRNIQGNLSQIFVLLANSDFKENECKQSGVIFGSVMRKLFSFQFRD